MSNILKNRGLFITGTDTDVGKTYVGAQIVSLLHDNAINVVPRKPIESGCEEIDNELIPADASLYYEAVDKKIPLTEICPFRFKPAISPQRAARLINQPITLNETVDACTKNTSTKDYLVVEGAGGFYSPLCEDGKNSDLAKQLNLPVLLVAKNKLGCINHILLTIEAINKNNLSLLAIILNDHVNDDDASMNNFEDLKNYIDFPIFTVEHDKKINSDSTIIEYISRCIT